MTVLLFDPLDPPANAWPEHSDARAYIEGIARGGVSAMVANVRTRWLALRSGARVFPVTVNQGEEGDSYVCLPHSAYSLYALRELELTDTGWLRPVLRLVVAAGERLLRAADSSRIVHIDNWLLSTNLHGDWDGGDIPAIRETVVQAFPDHMIAVRSIDGWSRPALLAAFRADDWLLLPSRQIWVTDDLAGNWAKRADTGHDRRIFRRGGLQAETLSALSAPDAERIAARYAKLYIDKYSRLNPAFTPAWIMMTHAAGIMRYHVARDTSGQIMAVSGTIARADVLTTPVVGYDMSRPVKQGLYRIACLLANEEAMTKGLRANSSAGAASFKRNRGARSVIEYTAFYTAHLSVKRRLTMRLLALALNLIAVPFVRKARL